MIRNDFSGPVTTIGHRCFTGYSRIDAVGAARRGHARDCGAGNVPAKSVHKDAEVLFERHGALGLITLNRPRSMNALTPGMCVAMDAHLALWRNDDAIRAVVIRGAGDRAFCAGGDIHML